MKSVERKVTLENVTRLSEDALERREEWLTDFYPASENEEELSIISEELDRRAEIRNAHEQKNKEEEARKRAEIEAQMARYYEMVDGRDRGLVMQALIEEFEGEIEGTYSLDINTFEVTSRACSPRYGYFGQKWQHPTLESAVKHLKKLKYWALYERVVRRGMSTYDLARLQAAIVRIANGE